MIKSQTTNPSLFIQFAGQGVKYMDELRRLYTTAPGMKSFIQQAITEVKRQAAEYDDSQTGFFSQGLEADKWIEQPETTPDLAYLSSSPLSHPFIFLCQISNYISVLKEGIDPELLLKHTHSITGFSTGVVAAILVSMGLTIDELCRIALKVQAMFFWQGVRCQQSIHQFGVSANLESNLIETASGSPSCMASINNLDLDELKGMIKQFSDYGIVHPAYELMPGRWIVAGLPQNLIAFRHFLLKKEKGTEWKFIPSTIAAHCPFLNHAFDTSPLDAQRVGLSLKGSDLILPTWANDMGKDLRESDDVILDVMRAYFTKPAMWSKQIAPLLSENSIKYVLDFGPGAGVASLTENHIANTDIQVIRCTVPLGRKRLFTEILPLLEPN
ncbi:hypothetical protein KJ966_13500 [bacterium]|nr:hypothetical protein [bacterium]